MNIDFLHTIECNENTNECDKGAANMASSVLQVRVDESLRAQTAAIYEDLGIDLQTAFTAREVRALIETIRSRGVHIEPGPVDAVLPDLDDVVFYAVVMEKRKGEDAYLVTGNQKHFPKEPFIVTPKEMLDIILGTDE